MLFKDKTYSIENTLSFLIKAFLFILPWQTILILEEKFLGGYKWQWGTVGLFVTEILLWIIIVLFTVSLWEKIKERKKEKKFNLFSRDRLFIISILVFVVYCLLSSFWAIDPQVAWQHGLRIMEAFLIFLVIFLGPVGFSSSARWLVAGSLLTALLGILQFFIQDSFNLKWLGLAGHDAWRAGSSIISADDTGRWLRAYGSFNHPNIFGGYLVMSLIVYVLLLYRSKQEESVFFIKGFIKNSLTKIALSYFLTMVLVSAVFFSFSRSALLALIIFLLVGLFLSLFENGKFYKIRFMLFSSLTFLVVLGIIFWPIVHNRVTASSIYEERSVE